VLARILTDRACSTRASARWRCRAPRSTTSRAWCLLAFVVSVVRAAPGESLATFALTAAYLLVMLLFVRPLARRFAEICERRGLTAEDWRWWRSRCSCLGPLHRSASASTPVRRVPAGRAAAARLASVRANCASASRTSCWCSCCRRFFAYHGLAHGDRARAGREAWSWCGLIVLVASLGKFGGSFLAARASGLNWRQATALGVLMNTRGLMELIVLNVGLDLGVLSPKLFTMMVLMALFTTFATTPVLRWMGLEREEREGAQVEAGK
jgi:hypothetical protein